MLGTYEKFTIQIPSLPCSIGVLFVPRERMNRFVPGLNTWNSSKSTIVPLGLMTSGLGTEGRVGLVKPANRRFKVRVAGPQQQSGMVKPMLFGVEVLILKMKTC